MNIVLLQGHLGQDAEIKAINDTKVAKFSIATTKRWTNQSGEKQSHTEWHSVECWGKLAEIAEKYFKKGTSLTIKGELKTDKYEKDGVTRYFTKVAMSEFWFGSSGAKSEPTSEPQSPPAPIAEELPIGQIFEDTPENEMPF